MENTNDELMTALFEVLKKRFHDHIKPGHSALEYIRGVATYYIPKESYEYHIKASEQQIIVDMLKA